MYTWRGCWVWSFCVCLTQHQQSLSLLEKSMWHWLKIMLKDDNWQFECAWLPDGVAPLYLPWGRTTNAIHLSIYQVILSVTLTTETVLSSKARPEHICRMTIRSLPFTPSIIIFCNQTNQILVLPLNWTPLSLWNDFSCIATSSWSTSHLRPTPRDSFQYTGCFFTGTPPP